MSRPGVLRLDGVFGLKGLGKPGTVVLNGAFELEAAAPDEMFWDGGDWRARAQRAWTGSGWFPPA